MSRDDAFRIGEDVLNRLAAANKVRPEVISFPGRAPGAVRMRRVATLAMRLLGLSWLQIATVIDRDHSTCIFYYRTAGNDVVADAVALAGVPGPT